jgi:hypothetical protein
VIAILLNTLSWLAVPAVAGCEPSALPTALDAAEKAFVATDDKAMSVAIGQVKRALGCAREPLPPAVCARVHRARALAAWLDDDESAAISALRGMLHADPRTELPESVVPSLHRLRRLLVEAEESPASWGEGRGTGWLLVDGLRTGAVPIGQPYVVQPLREDGIAQGAKVIERGGSDPKGRSSGGSDGSGSSPAQRTLRWTGLGLGIASVGLYGGAWATNGAYHRAVTARDDARIGSLHATTNGLSIGSVALLGLGAGAAVGGFTLDF